MKLSEWSIPEFVLPISGYKLRKVPFFLVEPELNYSTMWNKIKKGLSDTKDKAGRNIQYAKGKSSGFEHPEQVEETVQVCIL